METTAIESQFIGTPWKTDEEIYDFALHRKNRMGLEWEDIKVSLVAEGLEEEYANAIIENLKNADQGDYAKQVKKIKRTKRLCQIGWLFIVILLIRPIIYSFTVEHVRIISCIVYLIGFNGIKQTFDAKISSL